MRSERTTIRLASCATALVIVIGCHSGSVVAGDDPVVRHVDGMVECLEAEELTVTRIDPVSYVAESPSGGSSPSSHSRTVREHRPASTAKKVRPGNGA